MIIDIILLVVLIMAVIKGLRRGLIVALFSLVGFIVGLAAALKLSVFVASYLENSTNISTKWLPLLSFLIVFIAVVLLIRIAANVIEASVEMAWLGWINKLAGAILYVALYILIYSVVLFFMVQLHLISDTTIKDSVTYQHIEPWGPIVINGIGGFVPWFKDMFAELEKFFENIAQKGGH